MLRFKTPSSGPSGKSHDFRILKKLLKYVFTKWYL